MVDHLDAAMLWIEAQRVQIESALALIDKQKLDLGSLGGQLIAAWILLAELERETPRG